MEDRIVTITTCPYSRAQLIKGKLESEGIECFLSNINLVQPDVSSGVKVKINEKDTDRAYKIIEEMKQSFGEDKLATVKKLRSIRRILVPVDFSPISNNACYYALGIANKLKAELKLVYSYFNPVISSDPYLETQTFNFQIEEVIGNIAVEAKEQMNELKARLHEQAKKEHFDKVRISTSLDRGIPENVILDYIDNYKPGVVVMGTKGKGQGEFSFMGSVTKKIIQKAEVPVLAIPEKSAYLGIKYVNRVLYATNFDDSDFKSLRTLMTLVRPFHMKIYCVHIYSGESDPFDEAKMESLRNHFHSEYPDYKISAEFLMNPDIVEGIEDYIDKRDIDLIAMTSRKRGMFERFFNPSLAKRMLFHTTIPLLVFNS